MPELSFHLDLMRFLADHRTPFLTAFFQLFTFLGEANGLILLVTLVYVAFDKGLGFRLAVLAIASAALNHVLKSVIRNPRPFVADGTWPERWAVSPAQAQELVTEYSTPSGHAMGTASVYGYLFGSVGSVAVRTACVVLILLTGLSRPYLGVHYLEDVLLGWPIGLAIAFLWLRYEAAIRTRWASLSLGRQLGVVIAASSGLWLGTLALGGPQAGQPPLAMVGYLGFLAGLVVAAPLEARHAAFDPRQGTLLQKALRFVLTVALVIATLEGLDVLFDAVSSDRSALGLGLRYLRYAAASIVGLFVAPFCFVRWGWAQRLARPPSPAP